MKIEISRLISNLSASDDDTRAKAAEQIAQLGPDARPAAMALVLACGDEAEEVRQWAAAALEEIGPPEVADLSQLVAFLKAGRPT